LVENIIGIFIFSGIKTVLPEIPTLTI